MAAAAIAAASLWLALAGGAAAAVGPQPISLSAQGAHTLTPALHRCICAASKVSPSPLAPLSRRAFPAASRRSSSLNAGVAQTVGLSANGAYTPLAPTRLLDTRLNGDTLGPSATLNLTVTGGSVPSGATAVALNVTVTNTTDGSYLSVYPTGDARPLLSNLNWGSGQTVPNLVIVPVGTNGQVTFFNDQGRADVVVDLEGYFAPEPSGATVGSYVPLAPSRITDTRAASGEPYSGDTLGPGSSLDIQVAGAGGIPISGAAAALLNVTVTNTTSASYLTAYPEGSARPLASNLNWVGGETVANRVVVPVNPATGQIAVYNQLGNADVVIDVDGYFTNGTSAPAGASLLSTITPVRILDTRTTGQTLGPGASLTKQIAGIGAIPTTATAVVANVTAVDTTAPSYFTVYPGGARPLASDLNWSTGEIVANLTVATLGSGGAVSVYNDEGSANLIIDAFSYFGPRVPLTVTTASLPSATSGTSYSTSLAATGGVPPYSWAVTGGGLPSGLALAPDGSISGTTTDIGSFSITVQVTDSSSPSPEAASASFVLTVQAAPLQILTTSLPTGVAGSGYSAVLSATGGLPPYSWALISGALPTGLTLTSTGSITGTPGATGTFSLGLRVSDASIPTPQSASTGLELLVEPALSVITTSLPPGTVGNSYSTSLQASGGVPPYSWAVVSSGMPLGLGLSSTGILAGAPSTAGSYIFTVQVTDSKTPVAGTATATLSLEVYLGPPVLEGSPNWSGYAMGNGPYTYVSGTFDVPSLYSGQTGTNLSEWVGIDGLNDSSLIQAGIQEYPDPYNSNYFYIQPWWEILPAAETNISMTVSAGDLVTVTIQEYNPASDEWAITLTDDTSGASFTIDQTYAAPLSSAEWIMEAPMSNGSLTELAAYTTTTFTNLSMSGPQNQETELYMVQNGVQVSTPSALNATGFSVAYGATAPPPP